MWVKICGNTNLEDATLAAELGADAVGFVFAPSVRQVTPSQVAQITPHLPHSLERVGVFPAWSSQQIAAAVREAGLTTAQLHGGIDLDLVHALEDSFGGELRIIQTIHWTVDSSHAANGLSTETKVRAQLHQLAGHATIANRVLIDSKVGAATGGTGIPFDWEAAQGVFASENAGIRLILAGGLNPQNIAEAISRVQPWGVDVSSGVEASAGRKDPEKLASFIQEARALRARPLTS
jgi:phosphoribosylanthranilate isomerase